MHQTSRKTTGQEVTSSYRAILLGEVAASLLCKQRRTVLSVSVKKFKYTFNPRDILIYERYKYILNMS